MQTVRAAVIGCGGIASEAHIPNCFAIPDIGAGGAMRSKPGEARWCCREIRYFFGKYIYERRDSL